MQLAPGTRLRSVVCDTQIIVVRVTDRDDVDLRCGGLPMVPLDQTVHPNGGPPTGSQGTAIGKRYRRTELGLEVLCTNSGAGDLSVGDTSLEVEDPRSLPASD